MKTYYEQVFFIVFVILISCHSTKQAIDIDKTSGPDHLDFTVEEAPEWTKLFDRTHGWFGADGIFTIPLNGRDVFKPNDTSKTLIIFSDTMIGDIVQDSLQPGYQMIRNSVAVLKGNTADAGKLDFYWKKDEHGKAATVFVPKVASAIKGDIYWLGDGFMNPGSDSSIFVFAYIIRNTGNTAWGFKEVGNVLIEIPKGSKPPFTGYRQINTPLFLEDSLGDGSFGTGIFINTKNAGAPNPDGFVYVYGIRGKEKNVMAARVKPSEFKQFSKWRFFDGKKWNADIKKSANITDSASNELSVTPLPDGRYAMVFQVNGISSYVGMRLGETPFGPFGKVIRIWNCDEIKKTPAKLFAYNAKAHPNLSKPGELLISYNVNSFDFFNDLKTHPNLYRPRFIRLKLVP